MRNTNSLSNRIIALALSIVMVLGMLPTGGYAAGDDSVYGVAQSLTEGLTVTETGKDLKLTFAGKLDWVAKDPAIGRNEDGWWVGFRLTAPSTVDVEKAQYKRGEQVNAFKDYNDSADDAQVQYIDLWSLVREDYLRSANLTDGLSTYTWQFDWDGDGAYEQTVTLDIDADKTVLYKDGTTQVYPAAGVGFGKLEMLSQGATVTGNESASVSVAFDQKLTVAWVAADPSIGRYQDGWWAGMKLTAPAGATVEQLRNAQYMSGGTVKPFWTYKDSADDAAVHFITMWVPLNNLLTNSLKPYTYSFDWNDDGLFDQTVAISVDAAKVTLTKDGDQVYPVLGQVSCYHDGTVTGSGTSQTSVLIKDVTLNWSPADASIGRTKGWWVGIKVNAPEGISAEVLKNAKYQSKGNPSVSWDAVTEVKSFWSNKDSADTDESHNIQLWFPISPASVEKFKAEGRNITMVYRFNWDGQDGYEQEITFSVDPTGKIVLNKVDQADFRFTVEAPENIWIGDKVYQNVAIGGEGDGAVTYKIVEGDAATVDAEGKVTFTTEGTVTVQATKAADSEGYYNAATASYTISAVKKAQQPKFETTDPGTITYQPDLVYENALKEVYGGTVSYAVVNGQDVATIDPITGKLTVIKAGTVTVKATVTGDEAYHSAEATYTVVIEKAKQTGFAFQQTNPTDQWTGATFQNIAAGGQTGLTVTYQVLSGPATVDANGVVSFTGLGAVTVQATLPGNDGYEEATAEYVVTAVQNPWEPFTFAVSNPKITYEPNLSYPNAETPNALQKADDKVVYAILEGGKQVTETSVARIDPATGVLTVLTAGTVTVYASREADLQYEKAEAQYTLTVDPAEQNAFAFENAPSQLTWQAAQLEALTVDNTQSTGTLTWDITTGKDEVASIDADGKLTLLKAGTFTVTVKRAGDACYLESETISHTIQVLHADQAKLLFPVESDTITYNDIDKNAQEGVINQYTLNVTGGSSTGQVTYQLVEGDAVEIIGNVANILKSGTVKIKAVKAGDDQYNAVESEEFTLTVNKADQSFTFDHPVKVEEVYGLEQFATKLQLCPLNSGKVAYTASENTIGAAVDANGLVTFAPSEGKVGTVVITVTMVGDDRYNPFTETYTIELRYADAPQTPYTMMGDKLVKDGPWFTDKVTILAPADYLISYDNALNADWQGSVEWHEKDGNIGGDGCEESWKDTENAPIIYLKHITTGQITDAIFMADLKRDTQKPTDLAITYDEGVLAAILEKLFGFHASSVKVEFTAQDAMSGIAKMEYSQDGGAEDTFVEVKPDDAGKYIITVDPQYRGQIWARATDVAGNVQTYRNVNVEGKDLVLVVDNTAPGLTVGYTGTLDDTAADGIRYVKGDAGVTVVIDVTDENYDLREQDPVVSVVKDGETPITLPAWTVLEDSGNGQLMFTLTEEGDYILNAEFTDRLNRTVAYTSEVRIDRTAPVIRPVAYSGTYVNTNAGRLYFDEAQTVTLVIDEHNFNSNLVELTITANGEKQETTKYIKDNWTTDGDLHTLVLDFPEDGNYTLDVACADVLGIEALDHAEDLFTVDTVNPENLSISYESDVETMWPDFLEGLFGFGQKTVKVTVHAEDATAGIMELRYNIGNGEVVVKDGDPNLVDGSYSFQIPAEYEGSVILVAEDYANRETTCQDGKTVIVDNIAPEMSIVYDTTNRKDQIKKDDANVASDRQTMATADETTRFVYNGAFSATLRIEEAHFYGQRVQISVTRDGEAYTAFTATEWTDVTEDEVLYREKTLTMTEDGDYVITVVYADESTNQMNWTAGEYPHTGIRTYISNIHTIDTTAPEVTLTYTDKDSEVVHTNYHSDDRIATITVVDRNFRPNEVELQVVAKDVNEAEVTAFDYASLELTKWTSDAGLVWKYLGENKWTTDVEIPFSIDANYQVTLDYKDIAQNPAKIAPFEQSFTVDHEGPKDLSIVYSENALDKVMETITFGYWEATKTVTLTATDLIAGVEYFTVSAKVEGPTTATTQDLPEDLKIFVADTKFEGDKPGFLAPEDVTVKNENGTVTMTFDVPAAFRGTFSFTATDMGHLSSSSANPHIQVVDVTATKRTVTYEPTAIIDNKTLSDVTKTTLEEGDDVILYYNTDAVVAIEIEEANFYPENVHIYVNGQEVAPDAQWVAVAGKADSFWSNTLTLTEEGDYQVVIQHKDYSSNEMLTYTSQRIVIDKTAPEVTVEYGNNDVKNIFGERAYFDNTQTATVTIKDRNFRADDVQIQVIAKDVQGNNLLETISKDSELVKSYADQGTSRDSWTPYVEGTWRAEGDTYKLELVYAANANYTFDVLYTDLAKNPAVYTAEKLEDYKADQFTVDTKDPEKLQVSYQTSFWETVKESITFGYYNAQMTVTITAEDITSGIYRFTYSYINSEGVSQVNKELLDQAIKEAEITYSEDGKTATASFKIPKMVIENDNQFNGTVSFTAVDRSERDTDMDDTRRIVVDTIKPTAKISYNAPVQKENNISYYDGNINATIVINEANFDAADVQVSITRNGSKYPVKVSWRNNSVDVHTGTFTLSAEGDYVVSVQYKDKSGNQMTSYSSNQMTLDTTKPVIKVSNIKADSANKDEQYSFVMEVDDTNLDISSLQAALTTVQKKDDGSYETVQIDLGAPKTVEKGKTYTYTVEDLPEDGLYTLTCQVKDMAANAMADILLDDGKTYNKVQFSINRNGSAFGYGNDFTEDLVNQYYVYSVDQDVVIVEVNVDPIEDYKVTINGETLTEGTDYTTEQTSKEGQWSKRTYTVKKEKFETEGEYNIIVSSTDKAQSAAFSDVKNLAVAFVVDQTKPVLTITGLEAGGRYQTEAQTVTLIPTDEGGRLASLSVVVLDANGQPLKNEETGEDISVRFDKSGVDLLQYLEENDGMVSFTVPEGLNNQVKIVCTDCVSGAEEQPNAYNELFQRVTVSPNAFVIFYANTGAFVGTIVGVLAVIALIIFLIKRKKNDKNDESDKTKEKAKA